MAFYRVYYMRPHFFREGICGKMPDASRLYETHQIVAVIEATGLPNVFHKMQCELWSPNGEARDLIESLELEHTSMSVGDCVVDVENQVFVAQRTGFARIGKMEPKR